MVEHETERLFIDRAHPRAAAISEIDDSEPDSARSASRTTVRDTPSPPARSGSAALALLSKNLGRAIQRWPRHTAI
jgi:hypothetical protein